MMLKLAALVAAAFCCVSASEPPLPTPIAQQAVAELPIDQAARTKFPRDKPEMVDALASFNRTVNSKIEYVSDQEHYGKTDRYVSLPEDGKGDCEDYALSKMELLFDLGFPVISNTKLVMIVVHAEGKRFGHAILAVRLPSGDVAYLDLNSQLMTRAELEARGYEFFDWKA